MYKTKVLSTIKKAIILERKGNAFYQKLANDTEDNVKHFFQEMADEEYKHEVYLRELYETFDNRDAFDHDLVAKIRMNEFEKTIFSKELTDRISAVGFESAAIDAAITFEKNSIELYRDRAEETEDEVEKSLYEFLADWEESHLKDLEMLSEALQEKIWNDNKFFPY